MDEEPGVRWLRVGLAAAVATGGLLRLWELGRDPLDFDEAFTAMAARRPLAELIAFLRDHDAHPPLDYLVRAPVARAGGSEWALRLPSAVLSVAALVVFARWMRDKASVGLLATLVFAVGSFQLVYAREARMYAGMALVGVVVAWQGHQWLDDGRRRRAIVAALALLVALFLHSSALLLAAGMIALPGLRTDRAAWQWRIGAGAPVVTWGLVWGPMFLDQLTTPSASWIRFTTPDYLAVVVNELVDLAPGLRWLVVLALAAGGAALARRDRALGRVWVCGFVVPLAVAAGIGARAHFLLPRTLAVASWGPPLALAALVVSAARRWAPLGVATGTLVALVVLTSTGPALRNRPPPAAVLARARAHAADGDAVATHPRWLSPLVHWHLGVRRPGPERPLAPPGIDADGLVLGPLGWSGRVWLVEPTVYRAATGSASECAPAWTRDEHRLRCLQFPAVLRGRRLAGAPDVDRFVLVPPDPAHELRRLAPAWGEAPGLTPRSPTPMPVLVLEQAGADQW